MRYSFLLTIFFLAISRFHAMEPHFVAREIDEAYAHLNINLIFQDHNCMIWLGTSEGLMQFTGSRLINIPFPDSLSALSVTSLYEDKKGTLWAGTKTGQIFHYDVKQGLVFWKIEEGLPKVRITGFLEDANGQFWIGTYGEGLYVYSGARLYNFNRDDGLLDNDIYTISLDGKGRIWAGTDNGVNICSFNGKKQIRPLTVKDGLPDQIVSSIIADLQGNMWITSYENDIAYYDTDKEQITEVISDAGIGQITCITYFEDLELWIGTEGNGIWRYSTENRKFKKVRGVEALLNAKVNDLLKDVEGNIWVVSETNTLHTAFRPFETLNIPIGNIQSICASSQEQLWIGTDEGFYKAWEDSSGIWLHHRIPNAPFTSVACMSEDEFGNVWIGSLDNGLCVYDPSTQRFYTFERFENLRMNPVISLFIENQTLWLATLGRGVMKIHLTGDITQGGDMDITTLSANGGGSHNFVFQVIPKEGYEAWLATDGAGLAFTQRNHIEVLPRSTIEGPNTIYSLTHDGSGHIWFNTPDSGLVEYDVDKNSYRALSIDEGLRSMNISAVVSNTKGEILIVHNKGIDILIPEKRHFMYFDDEIGLENPMPVLNAVCKDASGNIWIGLRDKLVKYSALREDLSIHPRTRIEHVSVNQKPIDFYQNNRFPAHQNFFAFDYVGLWYTSPASVKYQYILEGHDLDWKESHDHLAIYSNLKHGKYNFRVKASENKFFYDEPLAEYAFEIRKPFWQYRWFIALATLCVVFLVYQYIKNREARLRRIEMLNKENIEAQFRALKAQINPHFLFNSFNTLITIIDENTDNPNVPIEYVQKLADFYRSILQYREEEAISIPEEITLVKNYYYLLQQRYGENLRLDVDLNGTQGFIPPLTLQMLVENAVKHNVISKSKPLTIKIHSNNKSEYLVVENNKQKKLSEVPSTKFGLQSIINRYEVISDKKVLVEESNESFKVSIPIIKNIF